MAKYLASPPSFNPDTDDYENFKSDVEVWKMLIKEDNKKQCGAAVYLSLQGTARDAVRGIETKVLQTEQGVDELFKLLDAVYLRDVGGLLKLKKWLWVTKNG